MGRKKALIFIEDGSFTYDNRVIREADAMLSAGWDVTVISPKYPDDPFKKTLGPHLRSYHFPKPTGSSVAGHLLEHTVSLMMGSGLALWVFMRHGFTVFHGCNPMDILWLIALPYKVLGRRYIFDQHDLCPELYLSRGEGIEGGFFHRVLLFLERASYRFADVVISTNESYYATAINRGGKLQEKVFVVRNGPDLTKFRRVPPREGLKSQGETLVGYLGNMNLQDGVDHLLEAAEEIVHCRSRHDIRFVLVGGGSHQKKLEDRTTEMGLSENVRFTGRLPDPEMLATLCACDICVQPDPKNPLNDKSTMNKVMEYMALGIPVVAYDLKETRVSCGDAAVYSPPNDPLQMAEKIIALAGDPVTRERMVELGRKRVEHCLAWQYSVPHLLAAYNASLGL
jgi:glycosyltransferase involved in cell wall biosynthesis